MFSLSVRDNVLLRRENDGDEELVAKALKESGAYEKMSTLEKGMETTVTREFDEDGVNFSVGEAQKLSLARVFAEKSPCIILDEPSSALDPISEHSMFENMMDRIMEEVVTYTEYLYSMANNKRIREDEITGRKKVMYQEILANSICLINLCFAVNN